MLLLALSVSICILATTLLFKEASSRWFYTLAFTSFAIYFFGESFAFVDESGSFFSSCFMFFIGLANYYGLEEKEREGVSKERDNLSHQKFIARLLIVAGFGFPIIYDDVLRVQWALHKNSTNKMTFCANGFHVSKDSDNFCVTDPSSRVGNSRLFVQTSAYLCRMAFLWTFCAKLVQWVLLDEDAQARSILCAYMSVVGFFLLRRTRVKESELEP